MRIGGHRHGWEGAALALILMLGLLTGCGLGAPEPSSRDKIARSDLVREVTQVLRKRVRAVRKGKVGLFLDGLVDDPVLRRDQRDYFESLRQLPLGRFNYSFSEDGLEAGDLHVVATMNVVIELTGFDTGPVRTPTKMTLVREQDGVLRIAAARDEEYERQRGALPQPWDSVPVEVRTGSGVLGIFDRDSARHAEALVAEVSEAVAAISPRVPHTWSGNVVVYALSDTSFLTRLPNIPGGDAEAIDGVAFPVPTRAGGGEYVGTRFLLHPRILERDPENRARLIRHELVHVALGQKDDQVPTWLSEGLAEYVAAQPMAPHERLIAQDAVAAARQGISRLPTDATFNGSDSSANYGIAWFACEYVAQVYGEPVLWRLFDAMRAGEGTGDKGQDAALLDVLGIDGDTLARATGERIISVFG